METKNTDTPVRIEIGITSDNVLHNIYISLSDTNNKETTADGSAEITMFKGKFADNDANKVDQFVFREKYDVKASDFRKTELSFRGVKSTKLVWLSELPDTFKPEVGEIYKISVYFTDTTTEKTLGNTSYIVWG